MGRAPSKTRSESLKRYWREHPEELAARHAKTNAASGRKPNTKCGYCGKAIERVRGKTGPKARHCSRECMNAAYRRDHLHQQYGLTNAQYAARLAAQGGACGICATDDPGAPGRPRKDGFPTQGSFHVDHDHESGEVRGLLCASCNRMLGQAKDSAATLRAGADYLERFATRNA